MAPPAPAETATLLVCCPDRRGIVAALAQLLYGHGANILDADQHTDPERGEVLPAHPLRSAPSCTPIAVALEGAIARGRASASQMTLAARLGATRVKRVAIFVSRYDHCLYDLLLRHRAGELACEIPLIVSNHPISSRSPSSSACAYRVFPITRRDQAPSRSRARSSCCAAERIDLVVLARYMQVLSESFIER